MGASILIAKLLFVQDHHMGCPGYASYNIHGNGLVEVNGAVATYPKSGSARAKIREAWEKYGSALTGAARSYDLPVTWLLAILMAESNGGKHTCSPCSACAARHCSTHLGRTCCAFTIMQFLPTTAAAQGANIEQMMQDDSYAIRIGAKLLSKLVRRYNGDFVQAATAYNAGSPRCEGKATTFGYTTNGDYAFWVVQWANTAAELKLSNKSRLSGVLTAAGVFTAGLIYADIWKPKWI